MMCSLKSQFINYGSKGSYFLTFEGIEGSGKSTQIKKVKSFFEAQNKDVYIYREPGGTKFGEHLREAILKSDSPLSPMAEAHLFASSRAQLLFQEVLPKLDNENTIVLIDRYIDSSIAYQAVARGLGLDTILGLHQNPPLNVMPHYTFYLQIDLETSFERQKQRGHDKDYFEKENKEFYINLISGYKLCAEEFKNRIIVIDGKNDQQLVFEQIKKNLEKLV